MKILPIIFQILVTRTELATNFIYYKNKCMKCLKEDLNHWNPIEQLCTWTIVEGIHRVTFLFERPGRNRPNVKDSQVRLNETTQLSRGENKPVRISVLFVYQLGECQMIKNFLWIHLSSDGNVQLEKEVVVQIFCSPNAFASSSNWQKFPNIILSTNFDFLSPTEKFLHLCQLFPRMP